MANNNPRPAPGRTLAWRPASLALATATAIATGIATAITAAAYSFCPGAGAQCLSQGWPRAGEQVPAAAGYGTRSLSHIAPPHAFSTDDSESAQIPVTAMDLGEKIGHEQAQNLPSPHHQQSCPPRRSAPTARNPFSLRRPERLRASTPAQRRPSFFAAFGNKGQGNNRPRNAVSTSSEWWLRHCTATLA
jgi:hypothetical protein